MDPLIVDTYRLPANVEPIHYDLKIRTDLKELVFDGVVWIKIRFVDATAAIVLNAFEIELGTSSSVTLDSGKTCCPTKQSMNPDTQRVTLSFADAFVAGSSAVLHMSFRAKVSNLSGYYKSDWVHDDITEYYTGTFFEPTYARRVFPCWDEPALKATFAVSMISRQGTVNLNNMPAFFEGPYDPSLDSLDPSFGPTITDTDNDKFEWIITRFETTPKMSTYIVAFANGPFAYVESAFTSSLTGRIHPVRIYATPDLLSQAKFPLELTTKVLPMLESMFDLPYPLPKMDILCTNGALGALENWGLIIGDPGAFLFDPATDSTGTKKRVVDITSHELSHQWFGNIVTMEWWDNLWLNEGFATLLGRMISHRLHPEWNVPAAAVNGTLKHGLRVDARLSSHPVQVECPDANNVDEIMDLIAYMKGASLLQMVLTLLGEEQFLKGVSVYLKEHQSGNSVAEDLWDALGRTSGTDVLTLMKDWICKTGYPVLTVTESSGGIIVRQNRFLSSGPAEPKDDEALWTVPLLLLTIDSSGARQLNNTLFLKEREKFIPLDINYPFKLNASSSGFYRVLYQTPNLNRLALEAAKGDISDMSGLLNDAMALAQANLAKLSGALTLMSGFGGTTEYIVLESIGANITGLLDTWWENSEIVEHLRRLDRHIFVPLVAKLGFDYLEGDATDTVAARTLAVKRAANARDPGVIQELRRRFSAFMVDKEASPLPKDLIPTIYAVAVRHGGNKEYDYMWSILDTTKSPAEECHAALAIGAAEDSDLMDRTFGRLLQENDGKVDWLLMALSTNPVSRRPMVEFFKDNYEALEARFENSGFANYSQQPFRLLATREDYENTVAFFKTKNTSKYTRSLEQTLEVIQTNIKLVERSTTEILDWFGEWDSGNK
ncbi:aminopeptidase [Favolaschia claudopus]|uniref:Aminopeptidase n=1 Tax=Favolaschia claudopus TaxID=2862362 RepID=A0AAW0DNC7_9AGAR